MANVTVGQRYRRREKRGSRRVRIFEVMAVIPASEGDTCARYRLKCVEDSINETESGSWLGQEMEIEAQWFTEREDYDLVK